MYNLKGFVTHSQFANNTPGVIAKIGELAPLSRTFSREKGEYADDAYQHLLHVNFMSIDEGTAIQVPNVLSLQVLKIANFAYQKTLTSGGQIYIDELLQELISTYASEATDFEAGVMVTDGTYWMPEWISWKNTSGSFAENSVKLWFVNDSFNDQYEDFLIVVTPPFALLDDFFKTGAEVRTQIAAIDPEELSDRVQADKDGFPETIARTLVFKYVDPITTTNQTPTPWNLSIYGPAGNNIDSIKDALQNFILDNSTHTREEWTVRFPDIFRRTEYIAVPFWNNMAIPNLVQAASDGINSPIVKYASDPALVKQLIPAYSPAHIDGNLQAFGYPYKSLLIAIVGSPENRDGKLKFTDVFPDYINVSSTSPDFNRMSNTTTEFLKIFNTLVLVAETMNEYSSIPIGYTRVTRNGVLCVVKSYQNIHYLVVAKKSLPPV